MQRRPSLRAATGSHRLGRVADRSGLVAVALHCTPRWPKTDEQEAQQAVSWVGWQSLHPLSGCLAKKSDGGQGVLDVVSDGLSGWLSSRGCVL